jgi:hypothetical protein
LNPKSLNAIVLIVPKYTKTPATIVESIGEDIFFVKYNRQTITQIINNGPHTDGFGIPEVKN